MSLDASERDVAALERLSALVDGELDGGAVALACAHWRESGDARSSWHAYQLIGDVLRSDDLAGGCARDAAFLQTLRGRLSAEPVVLAPQPRRAAPFSRPVARPVVAAAGTRRSRLSWRTSSAIAAGFVLVAGVVTLTRGPGAVSGGPAGAELAQLAPSSGPIVAASLVAPAAPVAEPQAMVASGSLIRDARLDRYLAAHKQFAGSSALGVPSGFLRNATAIESAR